MFCALVSLSETRKTLFFVLAYTIYDFSVHGIVYDEEQFT